MLRLSLSLALAVLAAASSASPAAAPGEPGEPAEVAEVAGTRFELPKGFQRVEDAMARGSVALVPQVSGESRRALLAAFAEGGEFGSATLVVGRVERPLELDPGVRSAVASAIAGHFRGELDLEVVVDRPTLQQGAHGPRLLTRAHTRAGADPRTVRFAFVPAGAVHYVLAASFPADREADFDQAFERVFESFDPPRVPAPPASARSTVLRVALFGAAGLALVVGLRLWQRRRRAKSPGDDAEAQAAVDP